MFDPLKVLVKTDLHPLGFPDFLPGVLLLKLTFFSVNWKISLKALLSEIALTYEKARLHGARCTSLSNLELDRKHLKKREDGFAVGGIFARQHGNNRAFFCVSAI